MCVVTLPPPYSGNRPSSMRTSSRSSGPDRTTLLWATTAWASPPSCGWVPASAFLSSDSLAVQSWRSPFLPPPHAAFSHFSLWHCGSLTDRQQTDYDSLFSLCGGDESAAHWHVLRCCRSPRSQQRLEAVFFFVPFLYLFCVSFSFAHWNIKWNRDLLNNPGAEHWLMQKKNYIDEAIVDEHNRQQW